MAESTENNIREAAKKVFLQKGYAGARMQEIADKAGINKAMLHYYYRSKDKLFHGIFEEAMLELLPKFGQELEQEGSVMDKLERVIRFYIAHIRANPHLPLFVLHELSQNRADFIKSIKKRVQTMPDFRRFFLQVREEQTAGLIRTIEPEHLLLNAMGMTIFPFLVKPIFCNLIEIPEAQFERMMEERAEVVVDFVRQALAP